MSHRSKTKTIKLNVEVSGPPEWMEDHGITGEYVAYIIERTFGEVEGVDDVVATVESINEEDS